MTGRVTAVNISEQKGQNKRAVKAGNLIKDFGLEGDAHGGKGHRQVSLITKESVENMKRYDIEGLCTEKFSVNIIVEGIALHEADVGTKFKICNAVLKISAIGKGCHRGCAILKEGGRCDISTKAVFARVIEGGSIRPGNRVEILLQ